MRLLFSTLVLLLPLCGSLYAQDAAAEPAATGIEFSHDSFEELLARAREEGKVVFIDAYTTWCGPCKMMSAKVFPDQRVGEFYNAKFINAKIDMEKGEGPEIAQRYGVQAYPTYLFVNGQGELVHRAVGYLPRETFIEVGTAAAGPNSLLQMKKRYEAGDADPTFINHYIKTLTDAMESEQAGKVVGAYLDNQDDWSRPEVVDMIVSNPGEMGNKRFIYLVEHGAEVEQVVGSARLMNALQQLLVTDYMRTEGLREMPAPDQLMVHYTRYAAPMRDRLRDHYALMYFQRTNQPEAYVPAAMAYYKAYPSEDFTELNSAAWTFYETTDDPAALAVALDWAKKSVALEAGFPNLDTLAWLHHKLGNDEEAAAAARRAIKMAEETGQDPGQLTDLVND